MPKTYQFEVEGTAAGGQTWSTSGTVTAHTAGLPFDDVMRKAFEELTGGRAVYGQPGLGCRGPYSVKRFVMQVAES